MDSMDWFTPLSPSSQTKSCPSTDDDPFDPATNQIVALHKVLKPGGRVLFRSAALKPWYSDLFAANGFEVKCVGRRDSGKCIDR
jgi:betaine lipid synthase